jgi:hypothetical protein
MYDPIGAYCAREGISKRVEDFTCKDFQTLLEQDPLAYSEPSIMAWVADQEEDAIASYALRHKLARFLTGLFELKAGGRCLDNEDDRIAVANLVTSRLAKQQREVFWVAKALGNLVITEEMKL